MKKNSFLWAALSITAALMMTACSSDDNDMTEAPVAPSTSKTIPYTVTVSDGATTRATVDSDNRTLKFATGDKLYITGTNIQGVLDLQEGDENKASGATFSGELTYTGAAPADDLSLTATLVSAQQTVGTQVSVNAAGAVTVNYPTTAYCTSVNDAVQQYSKLTGTSTYGAKAFTLTQQTAFLNFVITFEDGTATGTELSAVVNNGGTAICTANVTTTTESEKVVAKFVLPVASGNTLSSATVTMGDKEAIAFGTSQTLTGKVYNVKKTQEAAWNTVDLSTLTGNYEAQDHDMLTGKLTASVKISIADGATVTLKDANITNLGENCNWAGINCPGNATIILSGTNTVCAGLDGEGYNNYPGIWIAEGKTLTIQGNGSLTAYSYADDDYAYAAGIAAGIGGGCEIGCGNIIIKGGTITATGGELAAGIGGGYGSCGTITITGGNVTATGGYGGAGIGSGYSGSCGNITITSGVTTVTATKGADAPYSIGAGMDGSCDGVTIGGVEGAISTSPYTYKP